MQPPQAAVIAIGRELLTGRVLDRNTNFLAQELFSLGIWVRRGYVVDDQKEEVCKVLKEALDLTDLVLTSGGLGPTYDDGTLGYIADCLGLKRRFHMKALDMILNRYDEISKVRPGIAPGLNEARRKMAVFPEGGEPLYNGVGTAPGMFLEIGKKRIISLPGPPAELTEMFRREVLPRIEGLSGGRRFVRLEITVPIPDESVVDQVLKEVREAFPQVHFKTIPRGFSHDSMGMVLESWGIPSEAKKTLEQAALAVHERLE